MTSKNFSITQDQLNELLTLYPNMGKNSDVGKFAVDIAKLYFLTINYSTTFIINKKGIDLSTSINGIVENFEIKGTAGSTISWNNLKVSSKNCHDRLVNGMTLIIITNIGKTEMNINFLKHSEDFELKPEPRWSLIRKKNYL